MCFLSFFKKLFLTTHCHHSYWPWYFTEVISHYLVFTVNQSEWTDNDECFRDKVFTLTNRQSDQTTTKCHLLSRSRFTCYGNAADTGENNSTGAKSCSVFVSRVRQTGCCDLYENSRAKAVGCPAGVWRDPAWSNLHESLIFIFSHTQFITHESTCEIGMVTWFMRKWND